MQKFNWDLFKKGREVRTRDGRRITQLYNIQGENLLYPLVGVIEGSEYVECWQADGTFAVDWKSSVDEHNLDLFILDYPDEMTSRSNIAWNAGYWLNHAKMLLLGADVEMPGRLRKAHKKNMWMYNYVLENMALRHIELAEVEEEYNRVHGIITVEDEC